MGPSMIGQMKALGDDNLRLQKREAEMDLQLELLKAAIGRK